MSLDTLSAIANVRMQMYDSMRVLEGYLPSSVFAEVEKPYLEMQERLNEIELVVLTNMKHSTETRTKSASSYRNLDKEP